jgi:cell fate regulator YaaT (PSP1 superfamily)
MNIAGVQFRRAGRIYRYDASGHDLRVGDQVVVDTERGLSVAKVAELAWVERRDVGTDEEPVKPVERLATDEDLAALLEQDSAQAEKIARDKVARAGLDMRILKAESQGDQRITIWFSAPGRVDFRDLVKDLAQTLRARVELKQIGARDETKLLGGLGICGREYCCSSFLREFVPVSIKMAKNQNLALNPTKVSGGCGRLLCCLTYENDTYTELRRLMPSRGTRLQIIAGDLEGAQAVVLKADFLNQNLLIETSEAQIATVSIKDVEVLGKGARPAGRPTAEEEPEETSSEPALETGELWGEDLDLRELGFGADKPAGPAPQKADDAARQGRQARQEGPPREARQDTQGEGKRKRKRRKRRGGQGTSGGGESSAQGQTQDRSDQSQGGQGSDQGSDED